jgi:hypothetical protein
LISELKDAGAKEKYQVKISNRFTALENLDGTVDINRVGKNTREHIKISAKGR